MKTIKDAIISTIKTLPDDSDYEDIMEVVYIQQKIAKGIQQAENGEVLTHDEVKERVKKWLK